ncbi:hypothetical protein [Acetobacter okinawensis]|uniref:hypothetical protein n=1 Tax=Acetobacter TaxID=434 RepID=UPI001BA6847A|nr:hypothetical protein [Acetobacter okinawensis]MBS0988501.1 hypothetical protein [Acetobacter okinawensis]
MTPDEAWTVFGVSDPIKHGKAWAESVWGVDGLPMSLAVQLVPQEADALGKTMTARGGAPLVEHYCSAFTISAKARLFDLYMSRHHGGCA